MRVVPGMIGVDERETARLVQLMELLRELSRDMDPVRSVNRYAAAMRQLYGEQAIISVSLWGQAPGYYRIMRFLHQQGVADVGLTDTLFAGPNAPSHSGGLIGEIIKSGQPVVFRDLHHDKDPVLGTQLAPYRLLVAFPVFDSGKATNWTIFLRTTSDDVTDFDIESRMLQANLMGGITNSKRVLKELREANAWIQNEVDEIAGIQRGLLPSSLPQVSGVDFATHYATYERAGGDFYDIFSLDRRAEGHGSDGPFAVLIADATGHGPSAAVVVAMLSALLRAYPHKWECPADVMNYINKHLTEKPINYSFITGFLAIIDPKRMEMTYACAGHNMPMVRGEDGRVSVLRQTNGIPLGVLDDTVYEPTHVAIEPGQTFLFYTDGITEAKSPRGELFGEERLTEVFGESHGNAEERMNQILERLREHQRRSKPDDDQTVVIATVA